MDEQNTATHAGLAPDLAYIDEHEDVEPEEVNQLIKKIFDPAVQIIEPTYASGQNTRLFISLCKKMMDTARLDCHNAQNEVEEVESNVKNIRVITDALSKREKEGVPYVKEADILSQLVEFQNIKLKLFDKLGLGMKDIEQEIGTLLRLGKALLADQKEKGSDIKVGRSLIRYTFQCSIINQQWTTIKKLLAGMRIIFRDIKEVTELEKTGTMTISNPATGQRFATELTFETLAQKIAEIATGASKKKEREGQTCEEE